MRWIFEQRFVKFGIVGLFGTVVNLAVFYIGREFIYINLSAPGLRANLSLVTAIFISTLHNFIWNRSWTWNDRKSQMRASVPVQFLKYCTACWIAILLQIVFTNVLEHYMHYLLANAGAIGIAAILNYIVNHLWTFGLTKIQHE